MLSGSSLSPNVWDWSRISLLAHPPLGMIPGLAKCDEGPFGHAVVYGLLSTPQVIFYDGVRFLVFWTLSLFCIQVCLYTLLCIPFAAIQCSVGSLYAMDAQDVHMWRCVHVTHELWFRATLHHGPGLRTAFPALLSSLKHLNSTSRLLHHVLFRFYLKIMSSSNST